MSNSDSPAVSPGGPVPLSGLDDLPEKLRVHALAKLLGRTSREVLATLAELGVTARSAQSSVDRKAAEQVASVLVPELAAASAAAVPGTGAQTPVTGTDAPAPASDVEATAPGTGVEPAAPGRGPEAGAGHHAPPVVPPAFGAPVGDPAAVRPAPVEAVPDEGPRAAGVPALAPLFAPPAPVFTPPVRRTRRRGAATAAEQPGDAGPPATADRRAADGPPAARVPDDLAPDDLAPDDLAPDDLAPDEAGDAVLDDAVLGSPESDAPLSGTADDAVADPDPDADDQADDEVGGARRRRRRGRRGRGRGRGGEGDIADETDDADDDDPAVATDRADDTDGADEESDTDDAETTDTAEADEPGESADSRRRRRRRRRRGSGDDAAADDEADPPNTVVRVRAPRERPDDVEGDGVQSVRGSTRLEAKRQRRRDGRDAGRRRVPILSEAEFLARRESVERSMVVRERGDRVEVGVLEDGVLVEHFITGGIGQNGGSLVGNIYLGRVQNVLPSMEAAFVDIGRGRNAVLYAGEVDWDAAGLGGRARRIEQALSSGDSVLVQVTKDPVGHKGARLTTQISLAGRFLVYVPSGGAAGISRKLPDVERKRLKDLLREIVPSEAGVIIRTASEGVTQEALERDVRRLQAQWKVVKEKSERGGSAKLKAPVLLYEEPDMLVKVVRDQFNEDFSRLVVSGDDAWETVSNYVGHVASELAPRLHRHTGPRDVFEEYRIDEQLLKALDRKVWLPSGGTLVIDRTEAMTVIDVNTGKFTGSGGNLEETVTRNNLEAAEEIVRQLRLRDIGGIIVIDFIDMVLEANRDLVVRRLTECLARDRTRHQVAEVTSLGLVQMTRKRVGGGLLEHFSTPCEHCRGRGVIISTEPVTAEPSGHGSGTRDSGGDAGGRRSRGRSRRDEPSSGPRRLPDVIMPDRREAALDVGAPAPAEQSPVAVDAGPATPDAVEPATLESIRDDVEEVVVEQSLAAERARHAAPDPVTAQPTLSEPTLSEPTLSEPTPSEPALSEPAPSGAAPSDPVPAEPAPSGSTPQEPVVSAPGVSAPVLPAPLTGPAGPLGNGAAAHPVDPAAADEFGRSAGDAPDDPPAEPRRSARRRGRVTRTAGAPTATAGDAPAVAVVTVPVTRPDGVSDVAPATALDPAQDVAPDSPPASVPDRAAGEQPPAAPVAARPRRARRAASRPAGPPAVEAAADSPTGDAPEGTVESTAGSAAGDEVDPV